MNIGTDILGKNSEAQITRRIVKHLPDDLLLRRKLPRLNGKELKLFSVRAEYNDLDLAFECGIAKLSERLILR